MCLVLQMLSLKKINTTSSNKWNVLLQKLIKPLLVLGLIMICQCYRNDHKKFHFFSGILSKD